MRLFAKNPWDPKLLNSVYKREQIKALKVFLIFNATNWWEMPWQKLVRAVALGMNVHINEQDVKNLKNWRKK